VTFLVIPAKHVLSDAAGGVEGAGIQIWFRTRADLVWTPAFAGVTLEA
jgi:hypothetical protein